MTLLRTVTSMSMTKIAKIKTTLMNNQITLRALKNQLKLNQFKI